MSTERTGSLSRFVTGFANWIRAARASAPIIERTCPICGFHGFFKARGRPLRLDAKCPGCGSSERHRLFWIFTEAGEVFPITDEEPRILHFAPDPVLSRLLRKRWPAYQTADLFQPADVRLDMEAMDLEDESVDVVLASHILEHVDDRKACAEVRRVLRPGGRLIAMVPLIEGWAETYENSGVQTPAERLVHFGQADHVRFFGADFRERVGLSGLRLVAEHTAEGEDVVRYGLRRGEKVFVFEK